MVYTSHSTRTTHFQMERDFHAKEEFAAAYGHAGNMATAMSMSIEDAYLNGFLPELSFHSVLRPLSLTLLNYSPFDDGVSFQSQSQTSVLASSTPARYSFVTEEFSNMEDWSRGLVLDQKLKMPKHEGLNAKDFAFELLQLKNDATNDAALTEPLINFFGSSPHTDPSLGMTDGTYFTGHFSHLPLQRSLEQPQTASEYKHSFPFHPTEKSSSSFSEKQINSASTTMQRSAPYSRRSAGVSRQRRQRISDKTRCLEKLLPWNRRMDTATMLEEAYKYVKFLQAQIRVLQSMPIHSTGSYYLSTSENPNLNEFGGGMLARLNRHQLLEVVMNSPGAQTVLYSRGCCIYSMEQLLLLRKMAEDAAMTQLFFPSLQ